MPVEKVSDSQRKTSQSLLENTFTKETNVRQTQRIKEMKFPRNMRYKRVSEYLPSWRQARFGNLKKYINRHKQNR